MARSKKARSPTAESTEVPEDPVSNPRRTGLIGAIVAGGVTLVIAALVFTNSLTTERVASAGLIGARAEAALGANNVVLKALVQAVLLAEDRALGVADTETVQLAIDEAAATLIELEQSAVELDEALGGGTVHTDLAVAVTTPGEELLQRAAAGDIKDAAALLAGPTKSSLEALRDALNTERNEQEAALTSVDDVAETLATIAIFLVAFLLPVAAILAYRYVARRQLRVAEIQLDTRLAAEHEVVRAKDEFIANMSHELRTPLTSIYGFSEMLLETGVIDPDSAMDLIGMINHESSELGRMIEDLLVSARTETGALVFSKQPVGVRHELSVVLDPIAREGTEISVDADDVEVLADPVRFRQIVRNLVSNAVRYGGEAIRLEARADSGRFSLVVADNGAGVPAFKESRLFTRFVHEGDEALTVGSVGLGLAVVKALAEGMGGDATYGRSDAWTRFIVELPLAPSTSEVGHAPEPLGDLSRLNNTPQLRATRPTGLGTPASDHVP